VGYSVNKTLNYTVLILILTSQCTQYLYSICRVIYISRNKVMMVMWSW